MKRIMKIIELCNLLEIQNEVQEKLIECEECIDFKGVDLWTSNFYCELQECIETLKNNLPLRELVGLHDIFFSSRHVETVILMIRCGKTDK